MNPKKKIKLADIECVDNRKIEGIAELAENIKAVGLLQPILIRAAEPNAVPPYVVVDGRRRFRALELLKREFIEPEEYVLFTGEDELTSVAAFSANFARQNLTLAEEVEALTHLAGSQQEIAALLGKSASWVALRQNLANLTGKWVEVLAKHDDYPHWTPAKLELVAREPADVQEDLESLLSDEECIPLDELKDYITRYHHELCAAPFDTAGCANCPKRSGAQGLLFAEFDDQRDNCLDSECYDKRAFAHAKALVKSGLIPLRGDDWCSTNRKWADELNPKDHYEIKSMRAPKAGEKPNAVLVSGDTCGRPMVAVLKKSSNKGSSASAPASAEEKHEKTVAEREAELNAKRVKLALEKLGKWLAEAASYTEWVRRAGYDDKEAHTACIKLALGYGVPGAHRNDWYWRSPNLNKIKLNEFEPEVFNNFVYHCQSAVAREIGQTLAKIDADCGKEICGLLFLDWDELFMKPATQEIPEPKSLIAARIKEQQAAREKKSRGGAKK